MGSGSAGRAASYRGVCVGVSILLVDWFLTGGPLSSATANKAVDFVLYDFYLEDLTVSGRNFADVDALFAAKHAQIHGTNGRFVGDTWRDPASIA